MRFIFAEYMTGASCAAIARKLDEKGVISVTKKEKFPPITVRNILDNEEYTGCQIYQRVYASSPGKQKENKGELPMYRVDGHHEAIIDAETFAAVQAMRKERGMWNCHNRRSPSVYSGMVRCGKCGSRVAMHSTTWQERRYRYWLCEGKRSEIACSLKCWRDQDILAAVQAALG